MMPWIKQLDRVPRCLVPVYTDVTQYLDIYMIAVRGVIGATSFALIAIYCMIDLMQQKRRHKE